MPIPLFRRVDLVRDQLQEAVTSFSEERGSLTSPLMMDRPANEVGAWAETFKAVAARVAWVDVVRTMPARVVPIADAGGYRRAFGEAARSVREAGLTPVLLVVEPVHQRWIHEFAARRGMGISETSDLPSVRWEQPRPDPAYVAHNDEVPVYSLPPNGGRSFLLPREFLDTIRFTEQKPGLAVRAMVAEDMLDARAVPLQMAFERAVCLGPGEVVMLETAPGPRALP